MATESVSITAKTLDQARKVALQTGRPLVEVLEQLHGGNPNEFMEALGLALGRNVLSSRQLMGYEPALDVIPYQESLSHDCCLVRDQRSLLLVTADPFKADLLTWADVRISADFELCLAHRGDIAAWRTLHEEGMRTMEGALRIVDDDRQTDEGIEALSYLGIAQDTSPVIRLVNSTLFDALRSEASDIHLESNAVGMTIRYRLDGVLSTAGSIPSVSLAEQVISRIKVMSELDIAERRIPQDGRFRVGIGDREVDVRVSIMPSGHGEDAVLRILDKKSLSAAGRGLTFASLGFSDSIASQLRALASLPYGMLLVTGPTGSGKTTTLYAALSEINHGHDKIITIEDPIEYQLPGVLQIPVNERKGLTFARGLRSILRHDPDKIMVGEIRDLETAQIAIQSALTGHLVFTTVHANNVFDVINRFTHIGVDRYAFAASLNGILAQRLVRISCPDCQEDFKPGQELLRDSGLGEVNLSGFRFRSGRGCSHCRGTGYRGRRTVAEILIMTDDMRELIVTQASVGRLKEEAQRSGTRFLRECALDLVREGQTTLQEINRVTFVS